MNERSFLQPKKVVKGANLQEDNLTLSMLLTYNQLNIVVLTHPQGTTEQTPQRRLQALNGQDVRHLEVAKNGATLERAQRNTMHSALTKCNTYTSAQYHHLQHQHHHLQCLGTLLI